MKGLKEWTNEENGFYVFQVHYSADPAKDPDTEEGKKWVEREKQGVPVFHWDQEYEIMLNEGGSFFRNFRNCIWRTETKQEMTAVIEIECSECGHNWNQAVDYRTERRSFRCACCGEYSSVRDQKKPQYWLGVDLAKSVDFTVITVLRRLPGERIARVIEIDRFNQIAWLTQKQRIHTLWKKYRGMVFMDSTGLGDPLVEDMIQMGIPITGVKFTQKTKSDLVNRLAVLFERELIEIPDNSKLLDELSSFQAEQLPGGGWKYGAPEGQHDDMVISLALACRGLYGFSAEDGRKLEEIDD